MRIRARSALSGHRRRKNSLRVRVVSGRAQWLRWPQLRLFYAAAAVTAVAGNNGRFTVPALCRGLELQLHVSIHDTYSRAWLFEERIQIML